MSESQDDHGEKFINIVSKNIPMGYINMNKNHMPTMGYKTFNMYTNIFGKIIDELVKRNYTTGYGIL
jgi:hypothetical protein